MRKNGHNMDRLTNTEASSALTLWVKLDAATSRAFRAYRAKLDTTLSAAARDIIADKLRAVKLLPEEES